MTDSFSVTTQGTSSVEQAIQSYVFNLFTLGLEVPKSGRDVAEFEYRIYEAFKGLLEDSVVDVTVEQGTNNVQVYLY